MDARRPLLFVLPGLESGGAEHVMLAIAGELARRGTSCEIAAFGGGPLEANIPAGVGLTLIPSSRPWRGVGRLRALIRRLRPEAVLSSVTSANLATMMATRFLPEAPRVYLREANLTFVDAASGSLAKRISTLAGVRLLYRRATRLIALSAGIARQLQRATGLGPERIEIVPNPWQRREGDGLASGEGFRLGASRNLLACGRLEAQKDYPTLLDAFARIASECDAGLTIVGTGSLEQELRRQTRDLGVAERVDLRGYDPDPARLMRAADAFVLSSRWEGFPNVLLEAICEGCPVVSTRSSDAVEELVDSDEVGLLVPVGESAALADALRSVLARGRAHAQPAHRERYHLERIADLYAAIVARPA